jgi:hypothetical protein
MAVFGGCLMVERIPGCVFNFVNFFYIFFISLLGFFIFTLKTLAKPLVVRSFFPKNVLQRLPGRLIFYFFRCKVFQKTALVFCKWLVKRRRKIWVASFECKKNK